MKSAVIVFPGSNCDRDAQTALKAVTGEDPAMVWHKDGEIPDGTDLIVIPGGFSYGDYLRCGAMAANSPAISGLKRHAERGGYVLGVCNGFQVLVMMGLLPGDEELVAGADSRTRLDFNARAWDEMELTPEDCDVVFAYPWPNEEAFVDNVFRRHASANCLLLTFHDLGRVLVQRKVSHHTQLRTLGWM